MAITPNDVRLFASLRMTDNSDGGGPMSPNILVDGQDNNVFPDVTDVDLLLGAVNLRKLFGAVISENTDTYQSAHFLLSDTPDQAGVTSWMFTAGGHGSDRAAALFELTKPRWESVAYETNGEPRVYSGTARADGLFPGRMLLDTNWGSAPAFFPLAADYTIAANAGLPLPTPFVVIRDGASVYIRRIEQYLEGANGNPLLIDPPLPNTANHGVTFMLVRLRPDAASRGPHVHGAVALAGTTLAGATSLLAPRSTVKVVPSDDGLPYPSSVPPGWAGIHTVFKPTLGYAPIFENTDAILVHHTASTAPAAASNGTVVNTGRVNLSRLRVIDGNGLEVARFDKGIVTTSAVGTADLVAGTFTFTNVTGVQMPARVESRIEELNSIREVNRGTDELTLTRPMSREYPAGTVVSSLMVYGDLQARTALGFAQAAWTGAWSDSVIGSAPAADYNQTLFPFLVSNRGAITQRWALIFTSNTAFRLVGEDVGEVATGNTGADFAPLNPATGAPYFTVRAGGWGTWGVGNVLRINTFGANGHMFQGRTTAVNATGGADAAAIEFRGYINT